MKLDFNNERVMAVVAHPDDAELLCAGTLLRARRAGAATALCVMCRGDKGQPQKPIANLVAVRKREMTASARVLGAKLFMVGELDGTLRDETPVRRKLTEVFRQFQPTLVLAHAPEDYHPDHRAASALAEVASWFCASRGQKTRTPAMASAPALWWMDAVGMNGFLPGFYVDISTEIGLKAKMLACHASQLERGRDKDFAPLEELARLQASARGLEAGVKAAEAFRQHLAFKRSRAW